MRCEEPPGAEIEQGDNVACDECNSRLVVVGLDPIELDLQEESDAEGLPVDDDVHNYDYDDDRY